MISPNRIRYEVIQDTAKTGKNYVLATLHMEVKVEMGLEKDSTAAAQEAGSEIMRSLYDGMQMERAPDAADMFAKAIREHVNKFMDEWLAKEQRSGGRLHP